MLLLLWVSVVAPVLASVADSQAPDLVTYLTVQRLECPSATVTGRFYDWRSVSKYRRVAGLHLGYDIAMPAGSPAVAGWPGQVTRIACWYGPEYGITVLSPSGYETTYGHLAPRVKVGDVVNAGDVLGMVVNDHVDIKMRAPSGTYYDFGHSTPPPLLGLNAMFPVASQPTRGEALRSYLTTCYTLKLDEARLAEARTSLQRHGVRLATLRARVRRERARLPRLRGYLADGLVARVQVQQAERKVLAGVARVNAMAAALVLESRDVRSREASLGSERRQFADARRMLAQWRIPAAVVQRMLQHPSDPAVVEARRELQRVRSVASRPHVNPAILAQARARAERMKRFYDQGVVSRVEYERAEARYQALLKGD